MIAGKPTVHGFFEKKTCTWQYLVGDPTTLTAAIIDPVLDYDASTQVITTHTADSILALVKELGYKVEMVLETHIHADHLSAASYLQNRLCRSEGYEPFIGIGKRIGKVQKIFGQRYGIPEREYQRAFEKLFDDDETFSIGELSATAIHLPGHTPDHLGYQIGDNVFCGDSLFHPDIGTARCDFPGGSADQLYHSVRKLLDLPDHVKIWSGHDYPSEGRDAIAWTSVKAQKQKNKHLKAGVSEEEFVKLRKERDAGLAEPRLIHPSLQINMRAGRLPEATESGHRMLHLPLRLEAEGW
ncbi:unnamed protein product [Penicillium olsonii]|nr:unnamed protein product [Penicillium olsonii]